MAFACRKKLSLDLLNSAEKFQKYAKNLFKQLFYWRLRVGFSLEWSFKDIKILISSRLLQIRLEWVIVQLFIFFYIIVEFFL